MFACRAAFSLFSFPFSPVTPKAPGRISVLTRAMILVLLAASTSAALPQAAVPRAVSGGTLPSLGDNADLTLAAERRIGDRIAVSIYRDPDFVDDPVLVDYVQSIWQPLKRAAQGRGELSPELDERFAWQFFLLRDQSINAFALPGGYFGVHLGLIAAVSNRDELAAVLGHEMSHVTQRHISRLMTQEARQLPWLVAAMVLGALAASKSPNAASAAIVGGQALAIQNQLSFSRDMEREADRIGFGVMTDAGFESRGVTSMFEKLQQASRLNDNGAFPYLRSHPLNTERIAEAQSRVQLATSSAAPLSQNAAQDAARMRLLHAMMAGRARLLAAPGVDAQRMMVAEAQGRLAGTPSVPADTATATATPTATPTATATATAAAATVAEGQPVEPATLKTTTVPLSPTSPTRSTAGAAATATVLPPVLVRGGRDPVAQQAGALYAGALAAAQLRDFALSRSLLAALQPRLRGHAEALTAFTLLNTEIDLMEGKVPASAATIDMNRLQTRAEVLVQGRALLAAQRPQEVASRLQTWVADRPQDAAAWQLLSAAYTAQGLSVRAVRADAESRFAELDYPAALDRFKAAQGLMRANPAAADYVEGSILDTRARKTESIVKEQALQDKINR